MVPIMTPAAFFLGLLDEGVLVILLPGLLGGQRIDPGSLNKPGLPPILTLVG